MQGTEEARKELSLRFLTEYLRRRSSNPPRDPISALSKHQPRYPYLNKYLRNNPHPARTNLISSPDLIPQTPPNGPGAGPARMQRLRWSTTLAALAYQSCSGLISGASSAAALPFPALHAKPIGLSDLALPRGRGVVGRGWWAGWLGWVNREWVGGLWFGGRLARRQRRLGNDGRRY
jgi:hypothetical protein